MEINSSLLNSKSMRFVKESLINISKLDNKEKFRVKLVNYIDDSSTDADDEFFYEMLSFLRFLKPTSKSIAFTTPNKLIYMNAPNGGNVGESVRKWDFIYCHECLHQLWDTFGVAEKIKSAGIEYNHKILNIASDCIINEYLRDKRKKEHFEDGIYPETIEKDFGVQYDYRNDTQYTLYLKLLSAKEKVKEYIKNNPDMFDDMPEGKLKPKTAEKVKTPPPPPPPIDSEENPDEKHSKDYIKGWKDAIKDAVEKKVDPLDKNYKEKKTDNAEYDNGYNDCMSKIIQGLTDGILLGDSSSGGGNSGDLPQIPWDTDDEEQSGSSNGGDDSDDMDDDIDDSSSAQDAADEAKEAAKEAQDAADEAKKAAEKSQNEEDEKAAKEAQDAADEAKKAAKEAQDAADEAKEAAKNGDTNKESKAAKKAKKAAQKAKDAANKPSNGADGDDSGVTELVETEAELEEIRKNAEKIIEKYKNKIVGDFGSFIKKCKSSLALKKDGLGVNNQRGMASWNEILNSNVNAYVKKKIFQKKRQFEKTYSRVKRGSGFIEFGKPIEPGRKVKEQKLTINTCFYVDCSGSMGGARLNNATKAIYRIAEGLKKHFSKDKIVEDVVFKLVAWDTRFYDVKWGNKIEANGSTMSLEKLVEGVIDKSGDYLINIIITDGEFSGSDDHKIQNLLNKNIDGMFAFVINNSHCSSVKNAAKKYKDKIYYIEASDNFELK